MNPKFMKNQWAVLDYLPKLSTGDVTNMKWRPDKEMLVHPMKTLSGVCDEYDKNNDANALLQFE